MPDLLTVTATNAQVLFTTAGGVQSFPQDGTYQASNASGTVTITHIGTGQKYAEYQFSAYTWYLDATLVTNITTLCTDLNADYFPTPSSGSPAPDYTALLTAIEINTADTVTDLGTLNTTCGGTTTAVTGVNTTLGTTNTTLSTVATNTGNTKTSVDTVNTTLGTLNTTCAGTTTAVNSLSSAVAPTGNSTITTTIVTSGGSGTVSAGSYSAMFTFTGFTGTINGSSVPGTNGVLVFEHPRGQQNPAIAYTCTAGTLRIDKIT
jgi:hypothetical protein